MSIYRQARFALSCAALHQAPEACAEIAFAGRSNAGKSSALNTVTDQKSLARTSGSPGRTQLLNYFSLPDSRYLVDLPGYGYAKVPKKTRRQWHQLLEDYFTERQTLAGLILIMDCRHPLTELDWQMVNWAQQRQCPLHAVLTKADKLSRNQANQQLFAAQKALEQAGIEASLQLFSSLKKTGVDDLRSILDEWFLAEQSAQALSE